MKNINNKNLLKYCVIFVVILVIIFLIGGFKKQNASVPTGDSTTPTSTDSTALSPKDINQFPPKITPADPSHAESAAKADIRTITGTGFSLQVPSAWNYSLTVVNGCEDMTITKTKQTGDVDIKGQIDVWHKDCLPSYITYQKKAEIGEYAILVSKDEDPKVITGETATVYQNILNTFAVTPTNRPAN